MPGPTRPARSIRGAPPENRRLLPSRLLAVDGDAAPDQVGEVDAVVATVEAQGDALVRHSLAVQALREPDLAQQLDRGVLQHARPHPALDVVAAARLQYHRV